jgi:hypothetical protein
MKNLFFSVLLLLTVSFAFAANDVETVSTFDVEKNVELNNTVDFTAFDLTSENYSINKVVDNALGCLLTITFIYEDGSSDTFYVAVYGVTCAELGL